MIQVTVVHQAALGDTILLLPLFAALRRRFAQDTGCSITLVSKPNLGQMFVMLGFVENYASAEDRDHTLWFAAPTADKPSSLPAWASADLLLSAVSSGNDAWAANARLARRGGAYPFGEAGVLFFEPRPPADCASHVTEWHRRQFPSLSLQEPALPLPRVNPDGVILIHPGSGGDAKCWPRERFISLGRTLKRNGLLPTFILGEAEQERWGHKLIDELKDEFPWYLHMGLYELAERMSRARLYLGNDSGVTHVAAALGIPTIALFGPSNDVQWRPIGPSVKLLRPPPPDTTDLSALDEPTVLAELLSELRKI